MFWKTRKIIIDDLEYDAMSPSIISASRTTDIPAFHSEWLINRFEAGYCKWVNPFNQKYTIISLQDAKAIVFWSKYPKPMLDKLRFFEDRDIIYYFQYTLNDYEVEGLEPNLPKLQERINAFKELADTIGRDRVIWRFDPLLLSGSLTVDILLQRIINIADEIQEYTNKLVFSFADIATYNKVQKKLYGKFREFAAEEIHEFCSKLKGVMSTRNLQLATCGEKIDLEKYDILHNRCIDGELLLKLNNNSKDIYDVVVDETLIDEVVYKKDKGQRAECGCSPSKDIGMRDTCPFMCNYCYANSSDAIVKNNIKRFSKTGETIIG
ncbi:MAG: DUF1848 domain-containing protein [Phenylobacterium sp.]